MLSPTAFALYTFGAIWLALKYRLLLRQRGFSGRVPRHLAAIATAISVGFAVVVVPYVPIGDTPWCPDVDIPPKAAVALMVAVLGPLVDEAYRIFPPALALAAAGLTTAYLARTDCVGVATIVAGMLLLNLLVYISDHRRLER